MNAFLNFKNNTTYLYYCPYCLISKTRADGIQRHIGYCSNQDPQKVEYPTLVKEGNRPILQFNNKHYNRQFKHPFVGFADMEAILF